jgi:hypothetical protein
MTQSFLISTLVQLNGELRAPAALHPGIEPSLSIGYVRLGGSQSRSARCGEKSLLLARNLNS